MASSFEFSAQEFIKAIQIERHACRPNIIFVEGYGTSLNGPADPATIQGGNKPGWDNFKQTVRAALNDLRIANTQVWGDLKGDFSPSVNTMARTGKPQPRVSPPLRRYGLVTPYPGNIWLYDTGNTDIITAEEYDSSNGVVGYTYWPGQDDGLFSGTLPMNVSVVEIYQLILNYYRKVNPVICPIYGCTDPKALNYNPEATSDSGTCEYGIKGCTDSIALNYNPAATKDDGSCTYVSFGCTDPQAQNYNPLATTDDGSCTYITGCTDPTATNYNPNAKKDDGSCVFTIRGCTDPEAANFNPRAIEDDGSCRYNIDRIAGCTDPKASNYNPAATKDDGSCKYEPTPIFGCTDPEATNYNPRATVNDNSCVYAGPKQGCTDPKAENYDSTAIVDNGTCKYTEGCLDSKALNYNPRAIIDDGSCRYREGCMDPSALNYNPEVVKDNGTCKYGVEVTFKTIVRPAEANNGDLKRARIVLNGQEIGSGQVSKILERGLSYRVEFIAPQHPDYVFNEGVPSNINFNIPAQPIVNEKLEYVSTFTGVKLPSSYLNITANYIPAISDKSLLGKIVLNGNEPIELNKVTETFDPQTQTVIMTTGDNNVKLRVAPGVYAVNFKDVSIAGMVYTTPAPFVITIREGQTINETRTYLGKPLPPVYWLRPIDDSEFQQLNHSKIIGMFSDNISNLTSFFTSSTDSTVDTYYTHVNHKKADNLDSEIQFSLCYGHIAGSGSNGEEAQYNDSPTRAIYAQYRNIILQNAEGRFNLSGKDVDHFYAISYQKDRRFAGADYNAFELNIAHLSGSEFINGSGYMAAHTGSNVKLKGNSAVIRLISNSKYTTESTLGNTGVEYSVVSGSIEDGIYNPAKPHYYGKIYPSLGLVMLDADKMDMSASFGTVTTRELNAYNQLKLFTAISGAALFTDTTGQDILGMKARAVKDEMVNYYFLNVKSKEFNYTNNPSIRNLATGEMENNVEIRAKPYITTIGLYNEQRELLATVKLKNPIKKTFTDEVTFNVRLKI